MPKLSAGQPELYRKLFPDFFENEVPEETKATCSSCAMCEETCTDAAVPIRGERTFFRPETKCCTYHPNLPNFLVGAILSDDSVEAAEGRRRIEEKIRNRGGVTPYGVNAPATYSLFYASTKEFFGRSSSMRCPYYGEENGGICTIWRHRESVCSTYFCKYVAGADGRKFWSQMKSYLALSEAQLLRYATYRIYPEYVIGEKHPGEPPARKLEREELESGAPSEVTYRALWGEWVGMEAEFFRECFRLVSQLTREEFARTMGFDGDVSLAKLANARDAVVDPKIPQRLKLNGDLTIKWLEDGSVAIGAYSELDALALPGPAYELLKEFRGGETVVATRARLRRDKSSDFADEVLTEIVRHRILVED